VEHARWRSWGTATGAVARGVTTSVSSPVVNIRPGLAYNRLGVAIAQLEMRHSRVQPGHSGLAGGIRRPGPTVGDLWEFKWVKRALATFKELIRPYYLRYFYFRLFPSRRPGQFAECWRYPFFKLRRSDELSWLKLIGPSTSEPAVLFLPMTDWHFRTQRTQQLALSLADAGRYCFCLSPHLGREFPRVRADNNEHRISVLQRRIAEIHVRLAREPVFHQRLLRDCENRTVVDTIMGALRDSHVTNVIQIVSFPVWLETARALRDRLGWPIVYDCHDLLSGFANVAREIVREEAKLLEICDLAVFSSQYLLDEQAKACTPVAHKSLLLRNAADPGIGPVVRHIRQSGKSPVRTVGYVGSLSYWFDLEAVRRAAQDHPRWTFVLIGAIEVDRIRSLASLPNVELIGEVPHSVLGAHLASFDIAMIPFIRTDLTLAVNPIKLYEYMQHGLPVVATRLPELEHFGDLVYLADDVAGFSRALDAAAAETDASLPERRVKVATQETWNARATELMKAFRALCWSDDKAMPAPAATSIAVARALGQAQ